MLKGNPYALQSKDMAGVNERQTARNRGIKNRAREYVEDAGLKWGETPAITQDLALRYATTHDRHDGELLMQQLEMLKAKPTSSEDFEQPEFAVEITARSVSSLEEALDTLARLSRD